MAAKIKIKKTKVTIGNADGDISDMFNQILGTGEVDLKIAYPRYIAIKNICMRLTDLFETVATSPFMRFYEAQFARQRDELLLFCEQTRAKIDVLFRLDFSDYEFNLGLVDDKQRALFNTEYQAAKKSDVVNCYISMCDRLAAYKKNFIDMTALNHKFITNMPGVDWSPFPFTTLNLKQVFSMDGVSTNTIQFFMIILNRSFELSYKLWTETTTPDIDIDAFVDHIMSNIDEIKKRPELNRCGKAFDKIRDSVDLLKTRFSGYYRDFIETKDNTIIMQHFILDVSKETKVDAATNAQFRTIIGYYKKLADQHVNDPKLKMLFDKCNSAFKELDRGHENLSVRTETETPPPFDPADTISAAATAAAPAPPAKSNKKQNNKSK